MSVVLNIFLLAKIIKSGRHTGLMKTMNIYSHFFLCVCQLLSRVQLFVIPCTVACQAPLLMEFSRQEYWYGLPFLSPRDLPKPGIEPWSPALQADALPSEPPREATLTSRGRSKLAPVKQGGHKLFKLLSCGWFFYF